MYGPVHTYVEYARDHAGLEHPTVILKARPPLPTKSSNCNEVELENVGRAASAQLAIDHSSATLVGQSRSERPDGGARQEQATVGSRDWA
jgi:hypothetical protein